MTRRTSQKRRNADHPFTIHRCTECGAIRRAIAELHVHVDAKHRGHGPFNIIPPIRPGPGHYPTLMGYTEIIDVYDYEVGFDGRTDDVDVVTDGGELPDDHSIRCYDCERVVHRRHVDFVEVPVDKEDGIGYDMVPVPLCEDCRLRRYGVDCQHCGGYHWDIEGVVECERDRPSMLPDGGHLPSDIRDGPYTVCPESGDLITLGVQRGRAPDARDIDDLVAIEVCPHCRAEPAVVIVTTGDDECYHCGGAIR